MIDMVSEAEAIAKAKHYRSQIFDGLLKCVDVLRNGNVPMVHDRSGRYEGHVLLLSQKIYRNVRYEALGMKHGHVLLDWRGGIVDAIYIEDHRMFMVLEN